MVFNAIGGTANTTAVYIGSTSGGLASYTLVVLPLMIGIIIVGIIIFGLLVGFRRFCYGAGLTSIGLITYKI